MKKKKIYVAAPYSDPNNKVMKERFDLVTKEVGKLMKLGYLSFSPVTLYHPVAEVCELPRTWDYWEEVDSMYLEWADELWVLMIRGWKKSVGVNAEIRLARKFGKPVKYFTKLPEE